MIKTSYREIVFESLADQLKAFINASDEYPSEINTVTRADVNIVAEYRGKFPIVIIADGGPEIVQEKGPDGTRYLTEIALVGFVQVNKEHIDEDLDRLISTVRLFLRSSPSFISQILDIWDVEITNRETETDTGKGGFSLRCQMVWFEPDDDYVAPTGSDGYGDDYIKNGADKIVALMESLKSTMASGYKYKFENVYDRHNKPNLVPAALSVEYAGGLVMDDEGGIGYSGGDVLAGHAIDYSIRYHQTFNGDEFDATGCQAIVSSVVNKLLENISLGDGFEIQSVSGIEPVLVFDGGTIGAELTVTLQIQLTYNQA